MVRAFSTAASKNRADRLSGCGPNQLVVLNEPAMSTQQRAPTASARARPSVTVARFFRRVSGSASRRFTHRPTSAMTTSCRAKASTVARMRSWSSSRSGGQYAAR
jgi:hypothetical protein